MAILTYARWTTFDLLYVRKHIFIIMNKPIAGVGFILFFQSVTQRCFKNYDLLFQNIMVNWPESLYSMLKILPEGVDGLIW